MSDKLDPVAIRKATWRLLPIAMLLFFMSLLDRTNISFASLEMNKDLGLSLAQYGTAASAFFVGYFLFEIPSNFALERFGAKAWLMRIMITWGLTVIGTAFVAGATSLYVLRFLLGVAEAGLLPGLLLYLGRWLPGQQRGVAYATLLSTTAVAYAVGGPFTTLLMNLSIFGLKGWQNMFIIQGALTVLIGGAIPLLLPNKISDASWLSPDERMSLQAIISSEEAKKTAKGATTIRQGFLDHRVILTTITCFFLVCANFGTVFFLPQILRPSFPAFTNVQISLLISLAFIIGGCGGIWMGRHSDRYGDRKWHLVASSVIAAAGYSYAAMAPSPILQFVGICVGVLGIWSTFGVFWAYAGDLLGGAAAAAGLALINSIGSIGGVVAPNILAAAHDRVGTFSGSLFALAVFSLISAALAATLKPVKTLTG